MSCLLETLFVHVADNDERSTEQLRRRRTRQADRSTASDVDDRASLDAGRDGAVVTCWRNVCETGKRENSIHRMIAWTCENETDTFCKTLVKKKKTFVKLRKTRGDQPGITRQLKSAYGTITCSA